MIKPIVFIMLTIAMFYWGYIKFEDEHSSDIMIQQENRL